MQSSHESVFRSSFRVFCTALASIFGAAVAIGLVFFSLSFVSGPKIIQPSVDVYLAPDEHGDRALLAETTPVLLRIDFHGAIGEQNLTGEDIDEILVQSQEGFLKHRVKGILLHVDTPGGVANDSDVIYRALVKYKAKYNVPVYAFVEGLCASGGMYIVAAADKIYATPESIIGSVGVILGPTFNYSGTMEKIGVQSLTITEGKDKDMLNPFRPWKPGEDDCLRRISATLYERFINLMVSSRPQIDRDKLINEYGAQVYLSSQAKTIGYIDDANGDYNETVKQLALASGIGENEHYQVLRLDLPHNFLSDLFRAKSDLLKGKITHVIDFGSNIRSNMSGKFLYLYSP
jgi:signal peptide peptidase SppA